MRSDNFPRLRVEVKGMAAFFVMDLLLLLARSLARSLAVVASAATCGKIKTDCRRDFAQPGPDRKREAKLAASIPPSLHKKTSSETRQLGLSRLANVTIIRYIKEANDYMETLKINSHQVEQKCRIILAVLIQSCINLGVLPTNNIVCTALRRQCGHCQWGSCMVRSQCATATL